MQMLHKNVIVVLTWDVVVVIYSHLSIIRYIPLWKRYSDLLQLYYLELLVMTTLFINLSVN